MQPLLTGLLTVRQSLLPSSERLSTRCPQVVVDMRNLATGACVTDHNFEQNENFNFVILVIDVSVHHLAQNFVFIFLS